MEKEKTVSAEARPEHSRQELFKRYRECMRLVLRNQQEAYFSLVGEHQNA